MNDGNKTTDNCKCCDLTTQSAVKSLLIQVCSSFWNKFGKSKYNNFLETELSCIQKTSSFRIVYSQGIAHLFSAISCAVASLQLIDHLTVLLPAHLILLLHHLLFLHLKYNEIYTQFRKAAKIQKIQFRKWRSQLFSHGVLTVLV